MGLYSGVDAVRKQGQSNDSVSQHILSIGRETEVRLKL